jgi:ABC-type branched-subunit amino acid transport system permease subunit
LWIGRIGTVTPTIGMEPLLIAFIATVIGGMRSMTGAVVGGFVLALSTPGSTTLAAGSAEIPRRFHLQPGDPHPAGSPGGPDARPGDRAEDVRR